MIVDCAIYDEGVRQNVEPCAVEGVRARKPSEDAFIWIGLVEPTNEEFDAVRREFDLHELAVEDAVEAHQRPKLEQYGDTLFLVLKTVAYKDHEEIVDIGEVMVFAGADFLITVRHGEAGGLGEVREKLEKRTEILRHGPAAAMYALVDRVVDAYEPAAAAITEDIEEVEAEVFSDTRHNPVQRIYKLRLEVVEFHRAAAPLLPALEVLMSDDLPNVPPKIRDYYRDVADHLMHVIEQLESFRELLGSTLQANLTQVSVRQNEDTRRISAWVAIIAVPTAIAGIYGMNFKHMPEARLALRLSRRARADRADLRLSVLALPQVGLALGPSVAPGAAGETDPACGDERDGEGRERDSEERPHVPAVGRCGRLDRGCGRRRRRAVPADGHRGERMGRGAVPRLAAGCVHEAVVHLVVPKSRGREDDRRRVDAHATGRLGRERRTRAVLADDRDGRLRVGNEANPVLLDRDGRGPGVARADGGGRRREPCGGKASSRRIGGEGEGGENDGDERDATHDGPPADRFRFYTG